MQRRASVFARRIDLCAFIDKDSSGIGIAPDGDYMKHRLSERASSGVGRIEHHIRESRQVSLLDLLNDVG